MKRLMLELVLENENNCPREADGKSQSRDNSVDKSKELGKALA